jgi:hypothetical protein
MFFMEEDDAMQEAKRRAKKYLTRQRFFLRCAAEKSASCFWVDV